jgi:hypothetical protein
VKLATQAVSRNPVIIMSTRAPNESFADENYVMLLVGRLMKADISI